MSSEPIQLPVDCFETTPERFDIWAVLDFIGDRLDRAAKAGGAYSVPPAAAALRRLPTVLALLEAEFFWDLTDAEFDRLTALVETSEPDQAKELNDEIMRRRSRRAGLGSVLREIGHAGIAADALWQLASPDEEARDDLRERTRTDAFHAVTATFMLEHRSQIESLGSLGDRSGPSNPADPGISSFHHGLARIRSISAGRLQCDGTVADIEFPFRSDYSRSWELSHDCECGPDGHVVSATPRRNWNPVDRLFERFLDFDALRSVDSLLLSTRLFRPDSVPYTMLTDSGFGDRRAAIYRVPQVRLNASHCDSCGQAFLARMIDAAPLPQSREDPTGRPGRVIIDEVIQYRGPTEGSLLEFIDAHRQKLD